MTKIDVLCAGKLKENFYRDAVAEYAKRLSRYVKLNIIEVADGPGMEEERDRMLPKIKEGVFLITLEIEGEIMDSTGLSEYIEKLELNNRSHIMFVIGGSDGLHEDIREKANFKLSFSKFTFPHNLMRVILLEQLYRSYRIMNGEPYHK